MAQRSYVAFVLAASFVLTSVSLRAQLPQPNGGDLERGVLPDHWLSQGVHCMEIPEWQVHEYNANLYILRQSPCTDFEKPFVYLFFGKDRALLWDTGSRNGNIAPAVQHTVKNWLLRNNRASIQLVVVHSHEHEDHIFGDGALQALNDPAMPVTFVAATVKDDSRFLWHRCVANGSRAGRSWWARDGYRSDTGPQCREHRAV